MKNVKAWICLLISFTFVISCELEPQEVSVESEKLSAVNEKVTAPRFDVYIRLVDEWTGREIPAGTLPGYVATNLETGANFYDSRYEVGLFESLPIGTYRFDAYDGYFDGASSAEVEVSGINETPEGWIVVTLNYWSE